MNPVLSPKRAYRHVRASAGRMALSVVAVALGVALVVAFRLMNAAVLASFLDTADAMAGRAALTIVAGENVTFPEDVVDRVASVSGVTLAVPLVRSIAFPNDGSGEMLTVHGVDLTNEPSVRLYHESQAADEVIDDLLVFLSQPDSIVIGREFAERRGLSRGSMIELVTPVGLRRFTIRGLLDPQGLAGTLRGRLVVMDVLAAERAFTANGQINQIDVVLEDGADVDAMRRSIAGRLPASFRVEEPSMRREMIRKTITGFQAMITAFSLLAVVAGFVICYSRLGAVFEARTWEVGLLRAVGLSQRVVFFELLKESLLLGMLGTAIGVAIGVGIARIGLPALAASTAIAFRLPVPSAEASVRMSSMLVGALVGLVAAIGAAVAPALRLSRREPVAALTVRGRELPILHARRHTGLTLAVLLLVGASLALQWITGIAAVGYVTTVLIGIAVCVLARPMVVVGSRVLNVTFRLAFGAVGRLAAHHLAEHVRGVSLTVATLGLGLGVVLMFGVLGWSFERTLIAILARSLRADLIVSSAFVTGSYWGAPLNERLVDELASVPGVAASSGEESKEVAFGDGTVFLKTYDPPFFTDERLYHWPLDAGARPNALDLVARGEGVLVTRAFAHAYGTRSGDTIRLDSPSGPVESRVLGVSDAPIENAVVMSRSWYRALWNDPMVALVHVVLDGSRPIDDVEAAIAARFGVTYRLQTRRRAELIDYFAAQVRKAFSTLYLMEAIVFLLVVTAIGDTLATGVMERTRQFGMMRAIGLSRRALFSVVVLEGASLGLLGLLLAAAAGTILGVFWVTVQFPAVLGWKLELYLPYGFAFTAGLVTLVLCLVSAVVPSLRAAYLPLPAVLRND